jgi:hypothetical protein
VLFYLLAGTWPNQLPICLPRRLRVLEMGSMVGIHLSSADAKVLPSTLRHLVINDICHLVPHLPDRLTTQLISLKFARTVMVDYPKMLQLSSLRSIRYLDMTLGTNHSGTV